MHRAAARVCNLKLEAQRPSFRTSHFFLVLLSPYSGRLPTECTQRTQLFSVLNRIQFSPFFLLVSRRIRAKGLRVSFQKCGKCAGRPVDCSCAELDSCRFVRRASNPFAPLSPLGGDCLHESSAERRRSRHSIARIFVFMRF